MVSIFVCVSDSGVWSVLETQGVKPRARDKLQAAAIDNKIYYFGGFGPKSDEAEADDVSLTFFVVVGFGCKMRKIYI